MNSTDAPDPGTDAAELSARLGDFVQTARALGALRLGPSGARRAAWGAAIPVTPAELGRLADSSEPMRFDAERNAHLYAQRVDDGLVAVLFDARSSLALVRLRLRSLFAPQRER